MNNVTLSGRLTKEPDIRYTQGEQPMAIARYTLAVPKNEAKKEGQPDADFINCIAFGRNAEFAEKYFSKASKIEIVGKISTGSYTNKSGQKVYYTEVRVSEQNFAESKAEAENRQQAAGERPMACNDEGFMHIPDGVEDEGLPFN